MEPAAAQSDYFEGWKCRSAFTPIIVSSKGGDLQIQTFNPDLLREKFRERFAQLRSSAEFNVDRIHSALEESPTSRSKELDLELIDHDTIFPNLCTLRSIGFNLDTVKRGTLLKLKAKHPRPETDPQPYVDQIVATTKRIQALRRDTGYVPQNVVRPRFPGLILYAPATLSDVRVPQSLSSDTSSKARASLRLLQRQEGYNYLTGGRVAKEVIGTNSTSVDRKGLAVEPLFSLRAGELALGTAAIARLAASEASAVLRLPNQVNRTAGAVRQFAEHCRAGRSSPAKRLRSFKDVQRRINQAVPPEFAELIDGADDPIRIVSDAHLEWLDFGGIPLGIRKVTSRVPVTPGALFLEQVGAAPPVSIDPKAFSEVLLISAMDESEVSHGFVESMIAAYGGNLGSLNIKRVDVRTEGAFLRALEEFSGPMMIFDGHGHHAAGQRAALQFGRESVDVWNFARLRPKVPPIVVLSACDTHAADRNSASTANAFLALGATSVLASVLPLDARYAAIFLARLLNRVGDFIVRSDRRSVARTWAQVVNGMLRLQLVTDIVRQLSFARVITTEQQFIDTHVPCSDLVNKYAPDPFEQILGVLGKEIASTRDLRTHIDIAVANSSVISYLHLGRPESIILASQENVRSLAEIISRAEHKNDMLVERKNLL